MNHWYTQITRGLRVSQQSSLPLVEMTKEVFSSQVRPAYHRGIAPKSAETVCKRNKLVADVLRCGYEMQAKLN
jgi:hypothetical protein